VKNRIVSNFIGLVALCLIILSVAPIGANADRSAVIIMYHRFGENTLPSTNISISQFEKHLKELETGNYTVLPIPKILLAINTQKSLPKRTVGITIDDAYLSVYTRAWPRLKKAGFPFTLFVATEAIDRNYKNYMTWDQIRELKKHGVTIGSQTASHLHMPANNSKRNRQDIDLSNKRFYEELEIRPTLFAYPFGEASNRIKKIVENSGFTHAFGQHSGAVNFSSDRYYMPRFALNESFGGIKRFKLIANAIGIPYQDLSPSNPSLTQNPPLFGFTLENKAGSMKGLTCYSGGHGKLSMQRLGPRVEVRFNSEFNPGRARINCTAPGPENRWHWLGMLYYVPKN
jgi:peptidoglycan/xylan/chitin deacetylase (PgdA/CDA1 family)|tara:strand:- start:8461 stop:9492 length:1032 start_codon:yes stop_codon:yes gene_type:complete